MKLHNSKKH